MVRLLAAALLPLALLADLVAVHRDELFIDWAVPGEALKAAAHDFQEASVGRARVLWQKGEFDVRKGLSEQKHASKNTGCALILFLTELLCFWAFVQGIGFRACTPSMRTVLKQKLL